MKALISLITHPAEGQVPVWFRSLDRDRIGIFGHSLGGITASQLCADPEVSLKSGINMDAPLFALDDRPLSPRQAFAFFYSSHTRLPKGKEVKIAGCNDSLAASNPFPTYSLTFRETAHYNFSDFNLMPRVLHLTPLLGRIDGQRMADILNRTVLDFFDMTLKNRTDTLFQRSGDCPEEINLTRIKSD